MGLAVRKVKREMASELIPVMAFDQESSMFYLNTDEIGFGFIASPLWAADSQAVSRLNVLLNQDWPNNASLQWALWSGPDIAGHMFYMQELRIPEYRSSAEHRADFFRAGAKHEIMPPLKVRNTQVIITAKAPIPKRSGGTFVPEAFIDHMATIRSAMEEGLKTIGFQPTTLSPACYIRVMQTIFARSESPYWADSHMTPYSEAEPINEQVFEYDTAVDVEKDGVRCGNTKIKLLSVKKFPEHMFFGDAMRFIGEPIAGGRGIYDNCLITVSIIFPEVGSTKAGLETSRSYVNHQAYGPMLKHVPRLAKRKRAFDTMYEAMDDGDRPMRVYLGMAVFSDYHGDNKREAHAKEQAAVSTAKAYWREAGFHLAEDRYITLQCLLNMLPFGVDTKQWEDMFRYKTLATRHVAPLLPIFGDWKGTGTPILNFVSRRGQPVSLSMFDSNGSYNAVIAAQSGSGKSFLTNEIISSYLECGGKAWVIDVGRSYIKLCEHLGGQVMVFGPDSDICCNPFDLVEDYDEEADVLLGILTAMAAPTEKLSDFQSANLRRILKESWDKHGKSLVVDHIAAACLDEQDRRVKDIGHQLYAFTSKGEYGRFFNGRNNVRFGSNFVVVELEELKSKEHLQQVVLLQMVYQIQQDMYLGDKDRDKLVVIDEAWDLLSRGDIAKFIETGYRRFRKYRGAAVVVTQSINDLYQTAGGKAIADNSPFKFILAQEKTAIDENQKEGRLPLSDFAFRVMKTVHSIKGKYSEIFLITQSGTGVVRLIVDKYRRILYSTDYEDTNAISSYTAQGYGVDEAINMVLRDRGQA